MAWKTRRTVNDEVPFRIQGKVGRIEDPAPAVFFKRYVEANRPVVVTGALDPWPARGRWAPSYLAEVAGDYAGEVIVSKNGLYPDYCTEPSPMAKVEMRLAALQRAGTGPNDPNGPSHLNDPLPPILAPGESYYMYGKSYLLDAVAPLRPLREDIRTPACLGDAPVSTTSLWISSAGCVTPLHYDLPNGLLCQVLGSKQVFLFSPEQHDLVYPRGRQFPGFDNFERQSRVDIHHPDRAAFPDFARAQALECTLRQGDALFIPSNWFHEVETLELSISVTFGFAGGTTTSELAALSEVFKRMSGGAGTVSGMDLFRRAGETGAKDAGAPDLASDPRALAELMSSPAVERLLKDPAMLASLARLMQERSG